MDLSTLRRQLDESWISPIKSPARNHSDLSVVSSKADEDHVSSLASQLCSQMEQNNTLLIQLEASERNFASSQSEIATLRSELTAAQSSNACAADDNTVVAERYQALYVSMNSLRNEYSVLGDSLKSCQIDLEQCRFEKSRLEIKSAELENDRKALIERNSSLEFTLNQMKISSSESGQESVSIIQRLNMSLDQASVDLSDSRNNCMHMEKELLSSRDTIINLQRDNQRLSRMNHDNLYEREQLISQIKDLEDKLSENKRK